MASEERLRKWIDDIAECKKFIQDNGSMDGIYVGDPNAVWVNNLSNLKKLADIVGQAVTQKDLGDNGHIFKTKYSFEYKGIEFYEMV